MMKTGVVILIGGEKGGTGKSTVATNLAIFLALEGHDVMLLDADPQATASKWVERRNEAALVPTIHCTQKHGDIYKTAMDLSQRYSHVLIDAGGRDSRELRTGMVAADRMYVPIRASQADLETLPNIDQLITLAKGMNPDLQAKAVLSMAPSNPLITEVADAQALLEDFPELGLCSNVIRDRKVYRDALLQGKGVIEMNNSVAKAEIQLLAQEIFQ
jgi:chromosome partitioning protein